MVVQHPPRPQSDDSEESVAQLGPHDEEDEDDEDELDGLRTHVASRAQVRVALLCCRAAMHARRGHGACAAGLQCMPGGAMGHVLRTL